MRKLALVFAVIHLLMSADSLASDSSKSFTEINNETTHTVNCAGHGKNWSDCYQEAETLCPDGYKITKRSTGVVSTPVLGKSDLPPLNRSGFMLCFLTDFTKEEDHAQEALPSRRHPI